MGTVRILSDISPQQQITINMKTVASNASEGS